MSKFEQAIKRDGVCFDYEAYDVVEFSDGSRGIITGYGLYDNQYWCEFPESKRCGVSDWFSSTYDGYRKYIVSKIDDTTTINAIKEKYLNKLIESKEDFGIQDENFDNEIRLVQSMLQ